MTPHLEAAPGAYAETVLLPGDPLRAKWIAETFFDGARQVNGVRNCLGFTGNYRGVPVSVQATGMGQPSTAIYAHELIHFYGAKTLIRVGTCGGIHPSVKLRDVILAQTASTDGAMNRFAFAPFEFAPAADFGLLRAAADAAERHGVRAHVGGIVSSDIFYGPQDRYRILADHGVLGVEMEASTLYTVAARGGARALAVCTMSDCLLTGEALDAASRQSSLREMVTLALEVAVGI
ncbi:MAG: purine-nucleoside phosphorylase [Rhizobiaceae bacterium]|jgi:purine-nucleoside phosphorylase